jgi:dihydrofolate reductase
VGTKKKTAAAKAPGRRVRYLVAMSLDGYIADPDDGYDWIVHDPDIDFGAMFTDFDTALIGRRTFATAMGGKGNGSVGSGLKGIIFSRTLDPKKYPKATIVSDRVEETVAGLKAEPGKDIWLFGGGGLFASLLEAGLVDTVEVAVIPVLLGGGIPLLPAPATRTKLRLTGHRLYEKSGIMSLQYAVA